VATAVVVLKHETSTLRKKHTFISIGFKFGVGDYGREVTNPDKVWFRSDERSRSHVGLTYTGTVHFFVFCFFLFLDSSTKLQPISVNQF